MSVSVGDSYHVQDLPDRYIKISKLEEYIVARLDEFGRQWSLEARLALNSHFEQMITDAFLCFRASATTIDSG